MDEFKGFNKYEKNVFRAEAIEHIAAIVQDHIDSVQVDMDYYSDRITEMKKLAAPGEEDSDYSIKSYRKSLAQLSAEQNLWKSILNFIDKELMF